MSANKLRKRQNQANRQTQAKVFGVNFSEGTMSTDSLLRKLAYMESELLVDSAKIMITSTTYESVMF